MNEPAPNAAKIDRIVAELRRLRAAGELPVGWEPPAVTPPDANHMERMGVAEVVGERLAGRGVPGKSVVRPKPGG